MKMGPKFYRTAANTVTYGRLIATGVLVGDILSTPRHERNSNKQAATFLALGALDKVDGMIARLHPEATTPRTKQLDEQADKIGMYATDFALAASGRDRSAFLSLAVEVPRDVIVGKKRDQLREARVDAGARQLGKYKTGAKILTETVSMSRFGEQHPNVVRTMRVASAALTIVSAIDIVRTADEALENNETSHHQLIEPDQTVIPEA